MILVNMEVRQYPFMNLSLEYNDVMISPASLSGRVPYSSTGGVS